MERYSNFCEQSFRQQFDKWFDFLKFNSALVSKYCSRRTVIGFDPSYIPKSGKKTCGTGMYWSGCAGSAKWGLEICGIAAIDLDNHTAMLPKLSIHSFCLITRLSKKCAVSFLTN